LEIRFYKRQVSFLVIKTLSVNAALARTSLTKLAWLL